MELKTNFEFDKYGIGVEDIKTEAEQLLKQGNEAKESKGLFTVKTASRWIEQAKTRPIPKMLFGEFWFNKRKYRLFNTKRFKISNFIYFFIYIIYT